MTTDIRWKQRLSNFSNAFRIFNKALTAHQKESDNELLQMALIQAFEFTFELGWKVIKDYLYYSGLREITLPRDVIKSGFQHQIIENGQLWIDMMQDRNLMAHTYDEKNAELAISRITSKYHTAFDQLDAFFKQKLK